MGRDADRGWGQLRRRQSITVRPAAVRLRRSDVESALSRLGADGRVAADLDRAVEAAMPSVTTLSPLSAPLALDYMDRLARPIPSLTPTVGVQVTGRSYVAHLTVEADPGRFGAADVPVLGTLPPLKKGRPPQDILSRLVKASRGKGFFPLCALSREAWEGFVVCLTRRAHAQAGDDDELIPLDSVDGLARFAWILRQADLHYGFEPERP